MARYNRVTSVAGAILDGGASEIVVPRDLKRDLLVIKNPSSENEPLFYNFDDDAEVDDSCASLEPGESLVLECFVPSGAVHLNAATTGHKYVVLTGRVGGIE